MLEKFIKLNNKENNMTDIFNDENEEVSSNLELEKEFEQVYNNAIKLIKVEIAKADAALEAAQKIADQYGIPFYSTLSPLSQGYVPDSFEKKFPGLDDKKVSQITGVYDRYGNGLYSGWQHSDIC